MTQGFYSPLLLSLRFSYTILPFFPLLPPSSSPKFISYSPPRPTVIISNLFRSVSIEKDIREYANLRAKSSDAPRLKFCVASNNHLFHLLLSPSMSFLFSFINSDRSDVRTTACPIFLLFFLFSIPIFLNFLIPSLLFYTLYRSHNLAIRRPSSGWHQRWQPWTKGKSKREADITVGRKQGAIDFLLRLYNTL